MAKKQFKIEPSMPSGKRYSVSHRQNGSIEIYVAGIFMKFEAHRTNPVIPVEFKDGVPESVVKHPDFEMMRKYFIVTEI